MRFELEQRINCPADRVAAAFTDPRFYDLLDTLPKLGRPEVLSRETEGSMVHLRVRHQFTGDLNSAVRAAVDPQKLSWVDDAHHDLAHRRVEFRMIPDHYTDRFSCSGTYRFVADGDEATLRICSGELHVRMPLVGHRVEKAILSGLREHLEAESSVVEQFIADTPG
jgi:hypothetical protein